METKSSEIFYTEMIWYDSKYPLSNCRMFFKILAMMLIEELDWLFSGKYSAVQCCCVMLLQNQNKWKISICLPPLPPRHKISFLNTKWLFISFSVFTYKIHCRTNKLLRHLSFRNCQTYHSLCTVQWRFPLTFISRNW